MVCVCAMPFYIVPAGLWRLWDACELRTSNVQRATNTANEHWDANCSTLLRNIIDALHVSLVYWSLGSVATRLRINHTWRQHETLNFEKRFNWWTWTQHSWWNVTETQHEYTQDCASKTTNCRSDLVPTMSLRVWYPRLFQAINLVGEID
jgi:hypothetical protein